MRHSLGEALQLIEDLEAGDGTVPVPFTVTEGERILSHGPPRAPNTFGDFTDFHTFFWMPIRMGRVLLHFARSVIVALHVYFFFHGNCNENSNLIYFK